jgi:hypothetical protein
VLEFFCVADRHVSDHAWRTMFDELNDSSILKTGRASLASSDLFSADSAQGEPTAATIAKRFSALALP